MNQNFGDKNSWFKVVANRINNMRLQSNVGPRTGIHKTSRSNDSTNNSRLIVALVRRFVNVLKKHSVNHASLRKFVDVVVPAIERPFTATEAMMRALRDITNDKGFKWAVMEAHAETRPLLSELNLLAERAAEHEEAENRLQTNDWTLYDLDEHEEERQNSLVVVKTWIDVCRSNANKSKI